MFQILTIDSMNDYTEYTVLSNDTDNLTESNSRVTGKKSLSFDKVDGAANGTSAAVYRTISLNLEENGVQLHDKIQWGIYLSALTDVASCFIKLGTDASNNLQWTIADTSLQAGWNVVTGVIGEPDAINGNGWDPTNIVYMQIGVTFDAEDDTLATILIDSVSVCPARYTEDNTTISMDGVDVEVDTDALETINTAIQTAVELIDDGMSVTDAAAATSSMLAGAKYEATLTEMDDGDQAGLAITAFRKLITAPYDQAQNVDLVQDATTVTGVPFSPAAESALTAPGDGSEYDGYGRNVHTVAVTVVLNSCTNVVVRVDGTLDGTNYGICSLTSTAKANEAYANNLVTIDADITALLTFEGSYDKIKPVFVSEAGDTDSTVTFQYRGGN